MNADIAAYWREIRGEPVAEPPALPDYQPTLTIDAGCVVVTVCGQPSREDAEAMAALLVAVCERLKDVRA